MGPTVVVSSIFIQSRLSSPLFSFASQETISMQKQVPEMRKGKGVVAQMFPTPIHSRFCPRATILMFACSHQLGYPSIFFLAWEILLFGIPCQSQRAFPSTALNSLASLYFQKMPFLYYFLMCLSLPLSNLHPSHFLFTQIRGNKPKQCLLFSSNLEQKIIQTVLFESRHSIFLDNIVTG